MFMRYITTLALGLLLAGAFAGCPMQQTSVVGLWVLYLDIGCDEMDIGNLASVLYTDNTSVFLFEDAYAGTWSLNNSTLTITFPNVGGNTLIFEGTLGTDVVSDGMYTVGGMGNRCWSAQRVDS